MSKETISTEEYKIEPVDIHNLEEMIALGYRNPLIPRDESVWTKTRAEKELLKKTKRLYKSYEFVTSWPGHKAPVPVYGNIILQFKREAGKILKIKNGAFTRSVFCGQSEIRDILNRYDIDDVENGIIVGHHSLIAKYKWNGKWYSPNELPFFFWG